MRTIEDVLQELDRIVADAEQCQDYLCIFSYVYWITTQRIQKGIQEGVFEDNARMERFDVAFAKKYIHAYWQYKNREMPTRVWRTCFEARNQRLTIMQHLLMGMNAHIHFDLGITAAQITPPGQLQSLKADFMKVNDILATLIDEVQDRISRVSWLLGWIDYLGKRKDEEMVDQGIRISRHYAWQVACRLAACQTGERDQCLAQIDTEIARLGKLIQQPPNRQLRFVLRVIGWFEEKNVSKIVASLRRDLV